MISLGWEQIPRNIYPRLSYFLCSFLKLERGGDTSGEYTRSQYLCPHLHTALSFPLPPPLFLLAVSPYANRRMVAHQSIMWHLKLRSWFLLCALRWLSLTRATMFPIFPLLSCYSLPFTLPVQSTVLLCVWWLPHFQYSFWFGLVSLFRCFFSFLFVAL